MHSPLVLSSSINVNGDVPWGDTLAFDDVEETEKKS